MKKTNKMLFIVFLVMVIVVISTMFIKYIIDKDNNKILQTRVYDTPHYSISTTDNEIITIDYNQNMWPEVIKTYTFEENKLIERKTAFICESKSAANATFNSLKNNNQFSIENVTKNKNIVTSILSKQNISGYAKNIADLSKEQLYNYLEDSYKKNGTEKV